MNAPAWLSAAFTWLIPVRGATEHVHLVTKEIGVDGVSLCGQIGPLDRYARHRFVRVHKSARKMCNACFVASCRTATRIDWS